MIRLKSRVGPRGQVVVPKPVRDLAHIAPGDTLWFHLEEDRIIVEKELSGRQHLDALVNLVPKLAGPARVDWKREYEDRFG